MVWKIAISLFNLVVSTLAVYMLILLIKQGKLSNGIYKTKLYNKLDEYIVLTVKRNLMPIKFRISSPIILALIMIVFFLISFLVFFSYLKVFSTSLILSLPFLISPILIIKILLNQEKSRIIKALPLYVVNIKNHISDDNNIIGAIQRTTVEQPLKMYIDKFKSNISKGMNVIEAFDILKKDVNINVFTDFINSCQVCYLNGGDFNSVLEHYISMVTKENIHKESAKEKAYADILTLIVMIILNILVVIMFVFTNNEYALIMRETFLGKLILNFNALSYILIAYLISKIYKEE